MGRSSRQPEQIGNKREQGSEGCGPGTLEFTLQSCRPRGKMGRGEDDHRTWPTGSRSGAGRGSIKGCAVLKVEGQANRRRKLKIWKRGAMTGNERVSEVTRVGEHSWK